MKTRILCLAASLGLVLACDSGNDEDSAGDGETGSTGGESSESTGDEQPPPPPPPTTITTTMTTSDDESTGGGAALSCEEYCGIYMDACSDYAEYANDQHCLDHCAQWPIGAPEDVMTDSLGCRLYHVTVASSTDPELHCPHSGPSGELTCVANNAPACDLYCTRYFQNCGGDLNVYADMDSCLGQCGLFYPGTIDDTAGHTVGCRTYYAGLAEGDPDSHCPNAGPGGGEICVLGFTGDED